MRTQTVANPRSRAQELNSLAWPRSLLLVFVAALALPGSAFEPALVGAECQPWTSAELYALQEVQRGRTCDMAVCSSNDAPRLRSCFLAALLTRWPEVCPANKELPRVVSLTNALIQGDINLANLEVPFEVEITGCTFQGEVNFSKTVFRRSLHLESSHFGARAAFSAIVIGRSDWSGSLYLDNANFDGEFDLTDASIQRNLFATHAKFRCAESGPRFARLTVNGEAHFENAAFSGSPAFTQAEIKHGFFASYAQFNHQTVPAQFDDLKVGDDALFDHCIFSCPADFTDSRIKGDLQATRAEFRNRETGANFKSLKVDGAAVLSNVVCKGSADFTRAAIGTSLDLRQAIFHLATQTVLFHELKIDGDALFDGAIFEGGADFHASRVADELSLQSAHFRGRPTSALFQNLSVGGPASFASADFNGQVSFNRATFSTLDLAGVSWPVALPKPWLHLDGLKYDRISAGPDEDSYRFLIKLLDFAPYNANAYGELENFYQRIGYPKLADEVFFAQKYRERTDPALKTSLGVKAWSLFLDVFARYGRVPWMALLWALAVVLLGTAAFRKSRMEAQPTEKSQKDAKTETHPSTPQHKDSAAEPKAQEPPIPDPMAAYNAFWYSLDLFAPVIDLEAASAYRPKKADHPVLYHYSRIHRILGWVLVPIGAAAITGLTK